MESIINIDDKFVILTEEDTSLRALDLTVHWINSEDIQFKDQNGKLIILRKVI